MKKLLLILTLFLLILIAGCNNSKYESVVLKNIQLKTQIDSLNALLNMERQISLRQRMMADSSASVAVRMHQLLIACQQKSKIKE
jgi:hypothetical protein